MLNFSNLIEALAELKSQTGRDWTDSELFDYAVTNSLELHAAPPIDVQITASEWVLGRELVSETRDRWHLAVLNPAQIGQLWMAGETATDVPLIPDQPDVLWCKFSEPVRVTRAEVRIQDRTIRQLVELHRQAAGGTARPTVPAHADSAVKNPKQSRQRLLRMWEEEAAAGGEWGAFARVASREHADPSKTRKDILKGREERDAMLRSGLLFGQGRS